jgi:hypothetical protein
MVVRIGTWNLENLFKPPTEFGPKPRTATSIPTSYYVAGKLLSVGSKSH